MLVLCDPGSVFVIILHPRGRGSSHFLGKKFGYRLACLCTETHDQQIIQRITYIETQVLLYLAYITSVY